MNIKEIKLILSLLFAIISCNLRNDKKMQRRFTKKLIEYHHGENKYIKTGTCEYNTFKFTYPLKYKDINYINLTDLEYQSPIEEIAELLKYFINSKKKKHYKSIIEKTLNYLKEIINTDIVDSNNISNDEDNNNKNIFLKWLNELILTKIYSDDFYNKFEKFYNSIPKGFCGIEEEREKAVFWKGDLENYVKVNDILNEIKINNNFINKDILNLIKSFRFGDCHFDFYKLQKTKTKNKKIILIKVEDDKFPFTFNSSDNSKFSVFITPIIYNKLSYLDKFIDDSDSNKVNILVSKLKNNIGEIFYFSIQDKKFCIPIYTRKIKSIPFLDHLCPSFGHGKILFNKNFNMFKVYMYDNNIKYSSRLKDLIYKNNFLELINYISLEYFKNDIIIINEDFVLNRKKIKKKIKSINVFNLNKDLIKEELVKRFINTSKLHRLLKLISNKKILFEKEVSYSYSSSSEIIRGVLNIPQIYDANYDDSEEKSENTNEYEVNLLKNSSINNSDFTKNKLLDFKKNNLLKRKELKRFYKKFDKNIHLNNFCKNKKQNQHQLQFLNDDISESSFNEIEFQIEAELNNKKNIFKNSCNCIIL